MVGVGERSPDDDEVVLMEERDADDASPPLDTLCRENEYHLWGVGGGGSGGGGRDLYFTTLVVQIQSNLKTSPC